jgi:1-aminocyclopropane-1-carboxylate deaminase/D-cysteine desulfhydrase-like pyridoxal-dependent ACC family enzyme
MVYITTLDKTPLEEHKFKNCTVYVKRLDLCSPFPGSNIAKTIGFYKYLLKVKERGIRNIGVVDTLISRSGWAISYLCEKLGLKCYEFYPKKRNQINFNQLMCKSFGAEIIPQTDARYSIRYARAKKHMSDIPNSYMIPYLNLVEENAIEIEKAVYQLLNQIRCNTIILSVGSGASLAGVVRGISQSDKMNIEVIGVLVDKNVNINMRMKKIQYLISYFNFQRLPKIKLVNYGYNYVQPELTPTPFPCDIYYDRKAWKFLVDNIDKLKEPILFLNLGGEWDYQHGVKNGLRGDGIVSQNEINIFLKSRGLDYA